MNIFICICNYNAGNKLNDTFNSIQNAIKNHKDNIKILVFDNNSKDNSKDIISKYQDIITYSYISNVNIGKAKAINYLVNQLNASDDDLIFSLDSDIRLMNYYFFDDLIKFWDILKDKVSCLVCWQEGVSLYIRNINFINHNDLYYFVPPEGYGYGIAGGAIIIPYKYWKSVNGYRETCGLFGGDDGNIMLDLYYKTKKPICVIKNLNVFHPGDDNMEYRKWKDKSLLQQCKFGKCIEEKGFYD